MRTILAMGLCVLISGCAPDNVFYRHCKIVYESDYLHPEMKGWTMRNVNCTTIERVRKGAPFVYNER